MAGEEIYIARLGAWAARALGAGGAIAGDLDTEGLGFQLPEAITHDPTVTGAAAALVDAGTVLTEGGDALEAAVTSGDESALFNAFLKLFEGVYLFVDGSVSLVDRINARAATLPPAERDAAQAFGLLMTKRTIDFLAITLLEQELPRLAYLLELLGLIDIRVVEATGNPGEPRYVKKELRLDRIETLFTDPQLHFEKAHGWGLSSFDPERLFNGALAFYAEESAVESGKVGGDAFIETGPWRFSRDSSVSPPGLRLDYSAKVEHQITERLEFSEDWGTDFNFVFGLEGGAIFRLKPPFDISLEPKTGSAHGKAVFKVNRNPSARGFTIVGGNSFVRLTADDVGIGAELEIGASTTGQVSIDPGVFAELKGLTLSLGSEGADNFLAQLLAEAEVEGVFDIGIGWRLSEGLVVKAAGGLEIAIPMHQTLGFVTFETLYIILKINEDGTLALETSAAILGQLGPLSASVERMGVELKLGFSEEADSDLGSVSIDLGFKPPNGVGLALDAGIVKGGGYLFLDYEKGEYAGALELVFSGFLAVKAIGLINTKMPDGSDGFSLLIIVTAEFGTPIQLGLGFTLIGLGGLLGLNRTMMLEELAEGVRTGSVENIMFPTNVIANAPQIISDMRRFFPPKVDRFLVGPMAKLGWGTPTLVSVSIGFIIEIPPGNIAILGVLKCALPDEQTALLLLQVKFIGALEVDKQRLWFFASLFGSRVLFITLDGEMGLLIAWGSESNFVLSIGGFHPRFEPPPMPFPSPNRIALSILNESWARIRVEGYFAVTSNTVQFGAAVEIYISIEVLSIEGHLGFDALFQFDPFYFDIAFSVSLSVKLFGAGIFAVRFRGQLEGTSPWHIEGEGSLSILFFEISAPFSHTWGDNADTLLPEIAALPILEAELSKRENWLALPPRATGLSVSLRKIDATEALVLHPVGTLRVSQRALPLDLSIQKIGSKQVSDIESAFLEVNAPGLARKGEVEEPFATAQFQNVEEADKLSAPGYELQAAGIDISASGSNTKTSHATKRIVFHELITIDNNFKQHGQRFYNVGKAWFTRLLGSNATARAPKSQSELKKKAPFSDKIRTHASGFVIANLADNTPWGGAATFTSHAKAMDALEHQRRADPRRADELHVIPAAEAQ